MRCRGSGLDPYRSRGDLDPELEGCISMRSSSGLNMVEHLRSELLIVCPWTGTGQDDRSSLITSRPNAVFPIPAKHLTVVYGKVVDRMSDLTTATPQLQLRSLLDVDDEGRTRDGRTRECPGSRLPLLRVAERVVSCSPVLKSLEARARQPRLNRTNVRRIDCASRISRDVYQGPEEDIGRASERV